MPNTTTRNANIDWIGIATRDLNFIHNAIRESHPGMLEEGDQTFHSWFNNGFKFANEIAQRVKNEDQALAAVNFYTAGYLDGHLMAWQDRGHGKSSWAGWMMTKKGDAFVVSERATSWPVPLPPIGAKVISCDGVAISSYIEQHISPYTERRLHLMSSWLRLGSRITLDSIMESALWNPVRAQKCEIENRDGKKETFSLSWQPTDEAAIKTDRIYARKSYKQQLIELEKDIYWLHASNFQPSREENKELDELLSKVRKLENAKLVVLDTRGNSGGNSRVGFRILKALLKERLPEMPTNATAWYRVSDLAINTYESIVKEFSRNYGETHEDYKYVHKQLMALRAARSKNQDWLQQSTPDELIIESGNPFNGKLVLITDAWCASACLDFADLVLQVPGVVHMGHPTSADTNYLEAAPLQAPSGLMVSIPIKIWKGRSRGSNQPYLPKYEFEGDISDTPALQNWVLEKMGFKSL